MMTMMRNGGATLLATLMLGVLPGTLDANGLRIASQDSFATARGEAFVATADNPSAVYYNPAGITQITGLHTRSSLYTVYFNPTYQPPSGASNAGNTYHVDKNVAVIPQFFATYSSKSLPLTYGVGIYSPFGGKMGWPQDTGFRTVAIEGSVTYITLNPVVAWKLNEKWSVGAGVSVNYAKTKAQQGLLRNQQPFDNSFEFDGDGWMVGYNVGILWQPVESLSFGATFRSKTKLNATGTTEFVQQPIIQSTELDAESDYTFPLTVVFGVSYRPTPKWNIEFDADYTDWSSFGTTTIRQATPPPFPIQQNIPVTLGWQASWLYELGVTRYLDEGWQVSGGYVYSESSVPDTYYSPLAADLDRHVFSAGFGRKGRRFSFDIAYQFGYGPDRTVSGSRPSSQPAQFAGQTADGRYDFISHALLMTFEMRL